MPQHTLRTLWTVGHSTHDWPDFLQILEGADVQTLVDVRRHAGSRRYPQFSSATMARALPDAGIDYVPEPDLGGRRKAHAASANTGWRNASFRGYADHMASPEWQAACARLAALAQERPTTVMCAEVLWWRCHRRLISDAFVAAGWDVVHLQPGGRSEAHVLAPPARLVDGRLVYSEPPPPQGALF